MNSQLADPFATVQRLSADDAGMTEALTLLRKIERHLASIAADGWKQGPRRSTAEADVVALALYLPILGEGLGPSGRAFTAAEAVTYLHQHLDHPAVGSKAMGKLFARCLGITVAGFRIRRDGSLRGVSVWRIWRV